LNLYTKYFLRLLGFWLAFFLFQRLLFLAIYAKEWFSVSEWSACLGNGLRCDIAAAAYSMIPAFLLAIIAFYWQSANRVFNKIIRFTQHFFIAFAMIIFGEDFGVFDSWGTKVNHKAILSGVAFPKEALLSACKAGGFLLVVLAALIAVLIFIFNKIYLPLPSATQNGDVQNSFFKKTGFAVLIVVFAIIGMRGGLQGAPISRHQIFFSEKAILNYAALNSWWNLGNIISKIVRQPKNPYRFYASRKAADTACQAFLKPKKDTVFNVLNTNRPNVVLIFLESWSGKLISGLGGEQGVTPRFDTLAQNGILFTNFYSTGFRTEQGIISTLSCLPAQPSSSIIYTPDAFQQIPHFYHTMAQNGYHTRYYYGGKIEFDHIGEYMKAAKVDKIVSDTSFAIRRRTDWGAYDEELFGKFLGDMNTIKQPFFCAMNTLTSHEWFEADVPNYFHTDTDKISDHYRNTMHYTDSCLYAFLRAAEQKPWFKNTVFVIVADHSCRYPDNNTINTAQRYHIPMLLYGGALRKEWQGKTMTQFGNHSDIAATLLHQMRLKSDKFPYSRNLFNPYTPQYAYYAYDNGFGMVTPKENLIYDHHLGKLIQPDHITPETTTFFEGGKALLQSYFQHNMEAILASGNN
jgi:phosphoglycerol transferase MdoB-like AlkP superfamily enzyme